MTRSSCLAAKLRAAFREKPVRLTDAGDIFWIKPSRQARNSRGASSVISLPASPLVM